MITRVRNKGPEVEHRKSLQLHTHPHPPCPGCRHVSQRGAASISIQGRTHSDHLSRNPAFGEALSAFPGDRSHLTQCFPNLLDYGKFSLPPILPNHQLTFQETQPGKLWFKSESDFKNPQPTSRYCPWRSHEAGPPGIFPAHQVTAESVWLIWSQNVNLQLWGHYGNPT